MDINHSTDTITPDGDNVNEPLRLGGVGGIQVGSGTTAERMAGTPAIIRQNTETLQLETSGPNGDWWNPILDGSIMGVGASFLFNTSTTFTAPGDGYIILNNATPANVTQLAISNLCPSGRNANKLFNGLSTGDRIVLQQKSDTWRTATFKVMSLAADYGVWSGILVEHIYSNAAFTAGDDISFIHYPSLLAELNAVDNKLKGVAIVDLTSGDYTMTLNEACASVIAVTGVTTPGTKLIWPATSDGDRPVIQCIIGYYAGNDFTLSLESQGTGADKLIDWLKTDIGMFSTAGGGLFSDPTSNKNQRINVGDIPNGYVNTDGGMAKLLVGTGLELNVVADEYQISAAAGSVGDVIIPITSTLDFGNGEYSKSISIADTTALSTDTLLVSIVDGGTMSAEEAVIQGVSIGSKTTAGVGYVIYAGAPNGARGTLKVVSRKALAVNAPSDVVRKEVLTPQRYYGMTGDAFTTSAANPTGGANGDIHRNSSTNHVWTKKAGTWVDTGVAPAGYTGVLTKQYTFAHNLGVVPTSVALSLKLVSVDHQRLVTGSYVVGYQLNDILPAPPALTVWDNAGAATYGHAIQMTSTNVHLHVADDDGMGFPDDWTAGAGGKLENHNWELQVTVFG